MKSDTSDRDGPTKEYEGHHETESRPGGIGGRQRRRNLVSLLLAKRITPEEADAGRRFGDDFLFGTHRPSPSSLEMGGGGGGDSSPHRKAAYDRYLAAKDALDGKKSPHAFGRPPHYALIKFAVHEESFTDIALWWGGVQPDTARDRILKLLAILVEHYEHADAVNGRSETPHRAEDALKRLRPAELEAE